MPQTQTYPFGTYTACCLCKCNVKADKTCAYNCACHTELPSVPAEIESKTLESLTPADYVLAAQKVLTYLNRECAHPPAGMALENEVGRIIYRSLESTEVGTQEKP